MSIPTSSTSPQPSEIARRPPRSENLFHTTPCITEIEPNLFISNFAAACSPELIRLHRITAVITLKQSKDVLQTLCAKPDFRSLVPVSRHLWVKINDTPKTDISCILDLLCDFVDAMIQSPPVSWDYKRNPDMFGKTACGVLIHCQAGISRSGTTATAYLMRKYGLNRTLAMQKMAVLHPRTEPNPGFYVQLMMWELCRYHVWKDEAGSEKKTEYEAYIKAHWETRLPQGTKDSAKEFVQKTLRKIEQQGGRVGPPRLAELPKNSPSPKRKSEDEAHERKDEKRLETEKGGDKSKDDKVVVRSKWITPNGSGGLGFSWSSTNTIKTILKVVTG